MNTFVSAMLWRETRASWKKLSLLVFCIAAGVGGLVAVQAFSVNMDRAIQREARTLLAADIVMTGYRKFGPAEEAALEGLAGRGARITRSYEFVSMARDPKSGRVQTVSVRAVGNDYPYYGEVLTGSGQDFRRSLSRDSLLVENALLLQLNLQVGDRLELGQRSFLIADTLTKEPDSPVQLFRLGPRVLISEEAAMDTGLVGLLSRIRYAALIRLPQDVDPFLTADQLRKALPETFARINTYDQAQPRVSRFMGRLTDYLSLVGLVALLLGGVGVAGAVRVFMVQKMDTIAILKCLGAGSRQIMGVYLLQVLAMGLLGSAIGIFLGGSAAAALPAMLGELVPVELELGLPWRAVAEGLAMGLLTALWFALPPLLTVREVPPALVFRRNVEEQQSGTRPWKLLALQGAWALALATVLTLWQVGPGQVAGLFLAGLAGTVLALYGSVELLKRVLRRLPLQGRFVLRQGLSSLHRPGNQTSSVVVSLGLGVLLLLVVFVIQMDLLSQVAPLTKADPPNLFFLDIQPGQRQEFLAAAASQGIDPNPLIPVVRGRITAVNGEPMRLEEIKDDHQRRHMRYEYSFTYRGNLLPGEEIIDGRFDSSPASGEPGVSVAQWWSQDSGLGLGDRLEIDIQGVRFYAVITSVRKVDWSNRQANFTFVFPPGVLEEAPTMYVSAVSIPELSRRVALQREVVGRLPNITALDVQNVFVIVQAIMDRIALVVQFMAAFTISVGLVILLGAISTTRFQRIREAVLLKTLGATRAMVARVLALEYILLGALAGLVGSLAAGTLSWGLVTLVFQGHWRLTLPPYLAAWALAVLLVTGTGLLSSLDVLMKKPLDVLRDE
ncbi:MAG: FtsX-like permease family protein [Deltaproteobacteria bacterium]|nr:FtsX-like permease family protein [Deltaproteobacteria bacterium]